MSRFCIPIQHMANYAEWGYALDFVEDHMASSGSI